MLWFRSDDHIFHENLIVKFKKRNFKDVHEMNEVMIANHNSVVQPDDLVFDLGDVGFTSPESISKYLKRLNGIHHLVKGNHDKNAVKSPALECWEWVKDYHELKYKDTRTDFRTQKEFDLILFHFPISQWHGKHRGSIHVHGHSHSQHFHDPQLKCPECNHTWPDIRRFDVGVEANNYFPVSVEQVIDLAKDIDFKSHHLTSYQEDPK